jgi:hypothetical protein
MVIIYIMGREAFRGLLLRTAMSDIAVGEEVEWFGDRGQTILGTIGVSKNKGWSFARLTPDSAGNFRVCERQGNFPTRPTARHALLRQMAAGEEAEAERLAA